MPCFAGTFIFSAVCFSLLSLRRPVVRELLSKFKHRAVMYADWLCVSKMGINVENLAKIIRLAPNDRALSLRLMESPERLSIESDVERKRFLSKVFYSQPKLFVAGVVLSYDRK